MTTQNRFRHEIAAEDKKQVIGMFTAFGVALIFLALYALLIIYSPELQKILK